MVIIIKNKVNRLRKKEKITKKILLIIKIFLIATTAIFPMFMNLMSGIGWISTYGGYGSKFIVSGVVMIISSVLMTASVVLCMMKFNLAAVIANTAGFAAAMTVLAKMMKYADESGWSDRYTMQPASDIYRNRILPTLIPFILLIAAAVLQYFSYDETLKRKIRREEKEKQKNLPAPKILGD